MSRSASVYKRCGAMTKRGTPCKNWPGAMGSAKCHCHRRRGGGGGTTTVVTWDSMTKILEDGQDLWYYLQDDPITSTETGFPIMDVDTSKDENFTKRQLYNISFLGDGTSYTAIEMLPNTPLDQSPMYYIDLETPGSTQRELGNFRHFIECLTAAAIQSKETPKEMAKLAKQLRIKVATMSDVVAEHAPLYLEEEK